MGHVTLLALGTRGDLAPLGMLGRGLRARGHEVAYLTIPDYADLVRSFGVEPITIGGEIEALLTSGPFQRVIAEKLTPGDALRCLGALRPVAHAILEDTWAKTPRTDLIVYNPIAFFGYHLARDLAVPSMRIMCQPLMPSWRESYCLLFGGPALGGPLNRLSYEINRLAPGLLKMGRPIAGQSRFNSWANPLSEGLRQSRQVLAASPSLCADPGDWAAPVDITGFWHPAPAIGEMIPPALETFLNAGPPPIYIGFGSMGWGAKSITERVMRALRLWGGRAVLGAGGLRPEGDLPDNVAIAGGLSHTLLFPRLAGVVHHGGAGTTAAGLLAGRPTQILPVLGDQMYWGRRVAAIGAGPPAAGLHKISAEELARRFAMLTGNAGYRAAAARAAEGLARDRGLEAGLDIAEDLLTRRTPTT